MQKGGYKIIGRLRYRRRGLTTKKGFEVPKVIDWSARKKRRCQDYPGGRNEHEFTRRAFPGKVRRADSSGASKNHITEKNAPGAGEKVSVRKGANGPTTWQADGLLNAKGGVHDSGLLGNARRRDGRYFEWGKNGKAFMAGKRKSKRAALLDVMEKALTRWLRYAEENAQK